MGIFTAIIIGLIVVLVVIPLLTAMPTITISADAIINGSFYGYLRAAAYFLPMGTVSTILGFILIFWVFRIVVAIIKAFWEVLPFV